MTASDFKAQRPEFTNVPSAVIDAEIASAELLCAESVWGDKRDMGISLTVARALALSPSGRGMELVSDGQTVYDERLNELRRAVAGGPRVL